MCRSRRELSNAYLLAKFGFDTAENEPCQLRVHGGVQCHGVTGTALRSLATAPKLPRRSARKATLGTSERKGFFEKSTKKRSLNRSFCAKKRIRAGGLAAVDCAMRMLSQLFFLLARRSAAQVGGGSPVSSRVYLFFGKFGRLSAVSELILHSKFIL